MRPKVGCVLLLDNMAEDLARDCKETKCRLRFLYA